MESEDLASAARGARGRGASHETARSIRRSASPPTRSMRTTTCVLWLPSMSTIVTGFSLSPISSATVWTYSIADRKHVTRVTMSSNACPVRCWTYRSTSCCPRAASRTRIAQRVGRVCFPEQQQAESRGWGGVAEPSSASVRESGFRSGCSADRLPGRLPSSRSGLDEGQERSDHHEVCSITSAAPCVSIAATQSVGVGDIHGRADAECSSCAGSTNVGMLL